MQRPRDAHYRNDETGATAHAPAMLLRELTTLGHDARIIDRLLVARYRHQG